MTVTRSTTSKSPASKSPKPTAKKSPTKKDGKATGKPVEKVVENGRQIVREPKPTETKKPVTDAQIEKLKKARITKGTVAGFACSAVITVVAKKNPRNEGTNSWKKFNCLKSGRTIKEAISEMEAAGLKDTTSAIRRALDQGHITLSASTPKRGGK